MSVDTILEGMRELRAVVLGDICLDRWCYYDPVLSEPSRETGIPRLAVVSTEATPGAGGTIANNLAALGVGSVSVLGCVGEDGFGHELLRALATRKIAPDLMLRCSGTKTFTYTKIINVETGVEDRPRIDFVNTQAVNEEAEDQIIEAINHHIMDFDVVLVSDQAETDQGGIVTPRVRDRINELAADRERVFWVDSRMRAEHFRNVVLKPNRDEAEAACRRVLGNSDYSRLLEIGNLRTLVVTHGEGGAQVITREGEDWVPGRSVNAVDVCGAGDSFSAGAACALAITGSPVEAARFGNLVASVTVTKRGTGTASPKELRSLAELVA